MTESNNNGVRKTQSKTGDKANKCNKSLEKDRTFSTWNYTVATQFTYCLVKLAVLHTWPLNLQSEQVWVEDDTVALPSLREACSWVICRVGYLEAHPLMFAS